LNADQYYQAVLTRDARFDGRFFVAVKTTRIYCRPICRVKTPFRKNCTFYTHAAAAEVAGYRPCKRCRPELAPGASAMEVSSELARATLSYISQDFLAEHSLARRILANSTPVAHQTTSHRYANAGHIRRTGQRISQSSTIQRGSKGTLPDDSDGTAKDE
jgi:methylphosphotriester-DNA--protein-cysteine methyltransferase